MNAYDPIPIGNCILSEEQILAVQTNVKIPPPGSPNETSSSYGRIPEEYNLNPYDKIPDTTEEEAS